ncbi:MAG TPA: L,D-transpeptidase family protein, partial [Stellaceae bacterium]|nr:L,D-transpeptidase family protein [Stellaceae bacterium]
AAEYSLEPGQKVVGKPVRYTVKPGEVFGDIARQFDIGYTELVTANPGVNPWVPGVGRTLTIPTTHVLPDGPRQGIVINLAQWRLFYFPPGGDRVETFPITIGFIGKNTPVGATRIVSKEPNPTWYPPASIRAEEPELPAAVPPGPDNPLGAYAMHLGWKNYLLHGTNKPDSIGRAVSHGCMRLYPEDVEKLFGEVGVGTSVRTVQAPATAGWQGDGLYVQVYPSKSQTEEIDTMQPVTPDPADGVDTVVRGAAGNYAELVDWSAVRRAARERTGIAVKIADRSGAGIAESRNDDSVPQRYGRDYVAGARDESPVSRYEGSTSRYESSAPRYDSRAYGYYGPGYGSVVQDRNPASPRFDPATQYYRPGYGSAPGDAADADYDDQPAPLQMPPSHYSR